MIVDTSALIAIVKLEDGYERLLTAVMDHPGLLPAPAYVEFHRVVSKSRVIVTADAETLMADLLAGPLDILAFDADHASAATTANEVYGSGNGRGGSLNLLDLMVYGCAKVLERPILCTGRDFAATNAAIHPASRVG